jgi:endonuclease/exonuclease/phosphatase family metal-dependent hydrolase
MTWNVRSLRDDRGAVIRVLRACAPDVLFVQEAPRFLRAQSKLAALARESGLVVAAGGRPAAGVALLTTLRVEVDAPTALLLPRTRGLHERGVALARLTASGRTFTAASVHLGLDAGERQRHVEVIRAELASREIPAVIGGDLNERAGAAAWRSLATGRLDAGAEADVPTFPSRAPTGRIDVLLVPKDWTVSAVSLSDIVGESDLVSATDHRPVVVDVVG